MNKASEQNTNFNLSSAGSELHRQVFSQLAPKAPSKEEYGQYCQHIQAVENAAKALDQMGTGIGLLLMIFDGSSNDIDPFISKALRGLLTPFSSELERHADCLRAAIE